MSSTLKIEPSTERNSRQRRSQQQTQLIHADNVDVEPGNTGLESVAREKDNVTLFLLRYPEYLRTLRLALAHEEASVPNNYQGWQWHDVETHPTKLIRLVTSEIAKINLRTRRASYYLLRDPAIVKKALNRVNALS